MQTVAFMVGFTKNFVSGNLKGLSYNEKPMRMNPRTLAALREHACNGTLIKSTSSYTVSNIVAEKVLLVDGRVVYV